MSKRARDISENIKLYPNAAVKWKLFYRARIKAKIKRGKNAQRSIDGFRFRVVCGKLRTWLLQFAKTKTPIYRSILFLNGKSSIKGGGERNRDRLISLNRCFGRMYNYGSLQSYYTKRLQNINTRAAVDICVQYFEWLWVQIPFSWYPVCGCGCYLFDNFCLTHPFLSPRPPQLHLKLALNWSGASHCDVFAINPYRYLLNDFN